jgi:acyl-CoA synthetase (AMP-forming)/AMP-acid ligase II
VNGDDLIEFCRNRIASYKKPRSVEFVAELPVSGYGKILKRELRTQVLRDRAGAGEVGSGS